ncbi:hypothetical protein ACJJTC_001213 [Scirpophaga incertulas]
MATAPPRPHQLAVNTQHIRLHAVRRPRPMATYTMATAPPAHTNSPTYGSTPCGGRGPWPPTPWPRRRPPTPTRREYTAHTAPRCAAAAAHGHLHHGHGAARPHQIAVSTQHIRLHAVRPPRPMATYTMATAPPAHTNSP